ncbi:MAG: hypothetical protein HS126_37650 [Anaerolineales bacterium]|nr:hypothetical protein [Anaerolineales bacterium]
MFVNGTCPQNGTQLKITGFPAGTHPAWPSGVSSAAEQAAAYFAALKLVASIDDGLARGNHLYRDKTTSQPLTTLDEVVRAILADSLVMTESLCQDCLRPNPAHADNKGQCVECGGETCSCLACLDTLARLRAGEKDKARLGLRVNLAGWSEETGAVIPAEEV